MPQAETNLNFTQFSRRLCCSRGLCHLLNHPSGGQGHTAAAAASHCPWLPGPVAGQYGPMESTGLMPGSSSSALSWAGSTENSGLLFKARVNGQYANDRLPRRGRGGPDAGRPGLFTLGLSQERVCIPATGSGLARLGLFSSENKNLFQTKVK